MPHTLSDGKHESNVGHMVTKTAKCMYHGILICVLVVLKIHHVQTIVHIARSTASIYKQSSPMRSQDGANSNSILEA